MARTVWQRVRRRAQKEGVRPLKLHCARHTWASLALASGESVRWVADQLGHASTRMTLDTYAHAMREEETDLSFIEFDGPGRPDTVLDRDVTPGSENAHQLSTGERSVSWRARHDSNVRPPAPQAGALSN